MKHDRRPAFPKASRSRHPEFCYTDKEGRPVRKRTLRDSVPIVSISGESAASCTGTCRDLFPFITTAKSV